MRFDFTVYADTSNELREGVVAVLSSLPTAAFAPTRGFSVVVSPEFGQFANQLSAGAQMPEAAETEGTNTPTPAAPKAPRKARNAAAVEPVLASDQQPAQAPAKVEAEADSDPFADAAPPPAPGMSPGEAKLLALNTLREAYALPGGPAAVKALQTEYAVSKFVEVPDAKGPGLLKAATVLIDTLKAAA
jgi:hypothetical protein